MRVWSPSTPNGHRPRIWAIGPDVYAYYFGQGEGWLAHLRWQGGDLVLVREVLIVSTGAYDGHWLHPYVLTVWQTSGDVWQRLELDVRGDWTPRVVAGPSADVGGNWVSASGGHISEQIPGTLRYDGKVVSHTSGRVAQAGRWMAGGQTWDNLALSLWLDGVRQPGARPVLTPPDEIGCADDGSVAYGGRGPVFGFRHGGPDQDLTVTPWRYEGMPYLWTASDGQMWLATTTYYENDPTLGALLRPWGEQAVIAVPGGAVHVTVAESEGQFFVATCDAVGGMRLTAVPVNAPRKLLREELPPLSAVPKINRPFFVGLYAFKEAPARAKAVTIPVTWSSSDGYVSSLSSALPVETQAHLVSDAALFSLLADEHGPDDRPARTTEEAIDAVRPFADARGRALVAYQDSQGFRQWVHVRLKKGDALASPCFRNKGETLHDFRVRTEQEILAQMGPLYAPALGLHNRAGDLSTKDIIDALLVGFELCQKFGLHGCLLFADGRAGVPSEVWPYVERFLSGVLPHPPLVPVTSPVTPPIKPPVEPPVEPPTPPVEETDMPLTNEEFDAIADKAAPAVAKFWGQPVEEAKQGMRQMWDGIRLASDNKFDGLCADWAIGAGCRAKGAKPEVVEDYAAATVSLWQRRA